MHEDSGGHQAVSDSHYASSTNLTSSDLSDSFWAPGNYRRTTKRIDDGNRLCSDLCSLVSDRAEIERNYAKQLQSWASKWNNAIDKGPEYGTMAAAWHGLLTEGLRRSELHFSVRDHLLEDVVNGKIRLWQKDNYHKSMINQLKERREFEDAFRKAQKPWTKLLAKVDKCKCDYHNACKAERSALNHERNASSDTAMAQEQLRKLQDRVAKCRMQVDKTHTLYKESLADLTNYNSRYMEDMSEVYDRWRLGETERMTTFKAVLKDIASILDISTQCSLSDAYRELDATIEQADDEADLRWWTANHGPSMAMDWPHFQEYSEEFREIASSSKVKRANGAHKDESQPITLINQRAVGDDLPETNLTRLNDSRKHSNRSSDRLNGATTTSNSNRHTGISGTNYSDVYDEDDDDDEWEASGSSSARVIKNASRATNGSAVPSEPSTGRAQSSDDQFYSDPTYDDGRPGVRVRALYDYHATEDDEISLHCGDIFEKLEDEDEQGWSKGRKDGRVGLYPANYVQVI